jgi:hypothetical protein
MKPGLQIWNITLTPLQFIDSIRNSFIGSEYVYMNGSCYQFYKLLKLHFPNAMPFYIDGHVITKIGDSFYDITGLVDGSQAVPYSGQLGLENRKFSLWDCGLECPSCDEIVTYNHLVIRREKGFGNDNQDNKE